VTIHLFIPGGPLSGAPCCSEVLPEEPRTSSARPLAMGAAGPPCSGVGGEKPGAWEPGQVKKLG